MTDRTLTSLNSPGNRGATMVLCVGATHEQYSAIARSLGPSAEVLVAPDARSAMTLLQGKGGLVPARPTLIEHGPLRIDETERDVRWNGTPFTLCAREFDLLTMLARDWGRVWSFAELTESVWQRPYIGDSDAVISAVKRLRRRIAAVTTDLCIASVRGVGFRLVMRRPQAGDTASNRSGASESVSGTVPVRKAG